MTKFRGFGLSLSNEDPVATTLAMTKRAEELGFDEVSLPESRLFQSVTSTAAAALATTTTIGIRIGIANPVSRHPIALALEAATLSSIGPGRLRFGIGAAEWTLRSFEMIPPGWKPLTNTVEAVRAVRRLTAGETLGFEPTTFDASPTIKLDSVPARPVPVDVGAVSGRMLRASGEHADGVQLGAITSVGYTRWASEQISAGARSVGRDPGDVLVSANVLTSVDKDRAAARDAVRPVLAYYLARVEGVVVDESGADPEAVADVRRAVADDGVETAASRVADSIIDTFAVTGTPEDVVDQLLPFAAVGLHQPLAWYTFGPNQMEAIRLLAEQVRPHVVDVALS